MTATSVGAIARIDSDGDAFVDFPGHRGWAGRLDEMELVAGDAPSPTVAPVPAGVAVDGSALGHSGAWRGPSTAQHCSLDTSPEGVLCAHPGGIIPGSHWSCCGVRSETGRCAGTTLNRAGVEMRFGSGSGEGTLYCSRRLGITLIPGSDGQCGPNNGPQCADCRAGAVPGPTRLPCHEHALGAVTGMTNHFCDVCRGPAGDAFSRRCVSGCDFDVCLSCFAAQLGGGGAVRETVPSAAAPAAGRAHALRDYERPSDPNMCSRCRMQGPSRQTGRQECRACRLCIACCGRDAVCAGAASGGGGGGGGILGRLAGIFGGGGDSGDRHRFRGGALDIGEFVSSTTRDIGEFVHAASSSHTFLQSPSADAATAPLPLAPAEARALFAASVKPRLAADLDASWVRVRDFTALEPAVVRVDAAQRASLIALTESRFREFESSSRMAAVASSSESISTNTGLPQQRLRSLCDFKVNLTRGELSAAIGEATCAHLMALFGATTGEGAHPAATLTPPRVDEIVLRRVHAATAADERHIGFHSDASARTMQVVLNDGAEYAGGRLVFLSSAGALVVAPRVAGLATVHDASIVHGVTTMRRGGVRYSLFLLQSAAAAAEVEGPVADLQ